MNIIIESPGFKASDALEEHIREKVGKLSRFNDRIIQAEVTLFVGPPSQAENNHCEIRLVVPGNDLFVKKSAVAFERAVIEACDALQKIMQRSKDMQIGGRHDTGA